MGLLLLSACGPAPIAVAPPSASPLSASPLGTAPPGAPDAPTPDVAQALADAGDFVAAAAVWDAIGSAHPHIAATAEFNALMLLTRADQARAVQARAARYMAAYPNDPMRRAAAKVHARASEQLFDFEAAIASYIDVAERSDQPLEAAEPLMRASAICAALDQHLRAASLGERAVNADPMFTPSLLAVAAAYARSGANARPAQVAALERLAAADDHRWASVQAQVALAEMRTGERRAAAFSTLAARLKGDKDPHILRVRAQAGFEQLEPEFQRFKAPFRWPKTQAAQAARLKRLLGDAARLRRAYQDLIAPSAPGWALGSLWRVGRIFEVADARLRALPPPPGLSPAQIEGWRAAIAKSPAQGLEANAVEAWRAVVAKGAQLELSNPWTSAARAALCARDQCPPPEPSALRVTVPSARPPFAEGEGDHAADETIFDDLRAGQRGAQAAAIARFEARPHDRFARLNRVRAALQVAPGLARIVDGWRWVHADPWALDMLAASLMTLGDAADAHRLLTEATRLPGAPAEVYARLASIEAKAGRQTRALAWIEEALRRRPGMREAQQLRDQITTRTPVAK